MGTENVVTKQYLSDPERFAEVFNNEVFQGRQVIRAQKLRELDPGELAAIAESHKELKFLERYRDCMKAHEKKQDLSGDEYLGKFGKKDRIIPVISLVVYWGTRPWDGAKSLHELLDIAGDMSQYKDKIADYRMNLLEVRSMENLEQYRGGLKALLGFVKYQKDKTALLGFVEQNERVFRKIDTETSRAIRCLVNTKELEEHKSQEQIIMKLMKRFSLSEEQANQYYERFAES